MVPSPANASRCYHCHQKIRGLDSAEVKMKYDFNQEINRKDTDCVKWEFYWNGEEPVAWDNTDNCFGENRILPLWVADMDFPSPKPVVDALVARAKHGIFGYTVRPSTYDDAVVGWMRKRFGWEILPEWILPIPGVVTAIHLLVQTFVGPGEKVVVQPPVYFPFFDAVENNQTVIVRNPLLYKDSHYRMDFANLEALARDPQVKMLILCSPHNPVGRVWTPDELHHLGEICLENDVLVVSDEIHGDLIFSGTTFTSYATLGEDFAQNSVICTAPSKTFNLPGLKTSNIIISNLKLRERFQQTLTRAALRGVNAFGMVAMESAYNHGEDWLSQVMAYVEGNYRYLETFIHEHLPHLKVVLPEGTYLVWLDCRGLGLDEERLHDLLFKQARVFIENGARYGSEGAGFVRVNIACPRSILVEALERIEYVVNRIPTGLKPRP